MGPRGEAAGNPTEMARTAAPKAMEVETVNEKEAFEMLTEALKRSLKEAQELGAQAFREGRYSDVQKAAQRAHQIASELEHLERLRSQWAEFISMSAGLGPAPAAAPHQRGRKRGKRLPPGLRTPQGAFRIPILLALEELGGRGTVQQVIDRVGELMGAALNEVDRSLLPSGNAIRWHNTLQWCRVEMIHEGLLASDSPRGIWEITEKGRQYLREHRGEPE